jgi:hypothetical protein
MDGGERRPGTVVARVVLAHLVAYPIAMAWIVGAMPFCFPIFERELTAATGDVVLWGVAPMPAEAAIVVRATLFVGAIVFGVEHAVGVAWALAKDAPRGKRRFAVASLALGASGLLAAAGGWIWFLIHYG